MAGHRADVRAKRDSHADETAVDELDAIAALCRLISLGPAGERLLEELARRAGAGRSAPVSGGDDHAALD